MPPLTSEQSGPNCLKAQADLQVQLGNPALAMYSSGETIHDDILMLSQLTTLVRQAADILITSCMIIFLRKVDKASGFAETGSSVRDVHIDPIHTSDESVP